jgi:hypothetical protein
MASRIDHYNWLIFIVDQSNFRKNICKFYLAGPLNTVWRKKILNIKIYVSSIVLFNTIV